MIKKTQPCGDVYTSQMEGLRVTWRGQEGRALVRQGRQQTSDRKQPEEARDGQEGQLERRLLSKKLLSLPDC